MNKPQYISIDDAASQLGVKKGSLYYYIRELKVETHKFTFDRKAYLLLADFERIKQLKDAANQRGRGSEDAELTDEDDLVKIA